MILLLKKRGWLLLILFISMILMLRAIPADGLVFVVKQVAPEVNVQNVSGTLWQGEITSSVIEARGASFPLGRITWSLSPWRLFILSPCVDIAMHAAPQTINGIACYYPLSGSMIVREVTLNLPLKNLSRLLEVDIHGNLHGHITHLQWNGQGFKQADANILWRGVQINNGSRWVSLGDIQTHSNATEGGGLNIHGYSMNTDSPSQPVIQLTLLFRDLATQPSMSVDGTVGITPQTQSIRPMLQFIGDEVSRNIFQIKINQSL